MKKAIYLVVAALLSLSQLAQAAETGPVAEIFACTFRDGGDIDDVDRSTEFFKQQIAGSDNEALKNLNAYVWTPFKANTPFDILWFSNHANLNAFGSVADWLATSDGQAVLASYNESTDCASSLYATQVMYQGEQIDALQSPYVIEAYRCNLHEGKSMADVQANIESWSEVVTAQGGHDNYIAISMVPIASSVPYDVYYFGVHGSSSDYASRMTGTLTSDAGQMQTGKWDDIQRCESSLWFGRQVITGGGM